ncbi:MAG: hypothetical protein R3C11_09865 [Planctomycetaceae bacterium]
MSIFPETYYIIRPNERLHRDPRLLNQEWRFLIDRSFVWSRVEEGRLLDGFESDKLRTDQIKLLFMLDLKKDYVPDSAHQSSLSELLYDVLGLPNLRISAFDSYWTIERVDGSDGAYAQECENLSLNDLEQFDAEDDPGLLKWIHNMKIDKSEIG